MNSIRFICNAGTQFKLCSAVQNVCLLEIFVSWLIFYLKVLSLYKHQAVSGLLVLTTAPDSAELSPGV